MNIPARTTYKTPPKAFNIPNWREAPQYQQQQKAIQDRMTAEQQRKAYANSQIRDAVVNGTKANAPTPIQAQNKWDEISRQTLRGRQELQQQAAAEVAKTQRNLQNYWNEQEASRAIYEARMRDEAIRKQMRYSPGEWAVYKGKVDPPGITQPYNKLPRPSVPQVPRTRRQPMGGWNAGPGGYQLGSDLINQAALDAKYYYERDQNFEKDEAAYDAYAKYLEKNYPQLYRAYEKWAAKQGRPTRPGDIFSLPYFDPFLEQFGIAYPSGYLSDKEWQEIIDQAMAEKARRERAKKEWEEKQKRARGVVPYADDPNNKDDQKSPFHGNSPYNAKNIPPGDSLDPNDPNSWTNPRNPNSPFNRDNPRNPWKKDDPLNPGRDDSPLNPKNENSPFNPDNPSSPYYAKKHPPFENGTPGGLPGPADPGNQIGMWTVTARASYIYGPDSPPLTYQIPGTAADTFGSRINGDCIDLVRNGTQVIEGCFTKISNGGRNLIVGATFTAPPKTEPNPDPQTSPPPLPKPANKPDGTPDPEAPPIPGPARPPSGYPDRSPTPNGKPALDPRQAPKPAPSPTPTPDPPRLPNDQPNPLPPIAPSPRRNPGTSPGTSPGTGTGISAGGGNQQQWNQTPSETIDREPLRTPGLDLMPIIDPTTRAPINPTTKTRLPPSNFLRPPQTPFDTPTPDPTPDPTPGTGGGGSTPSGSDICEAPCIQGLTEQAKAVTTTVKVFKACNVDREGNPTAEFEDKTITCAASDEAMLKALFERIASIESQQCFSDKEIAIPESTIGRRGIQPNKLVIVYAEEFSTGKLGKSRWSLTVPYYNRPKGNRISAPTYQHGNWKAVLLLSDNSSQVVVNANSSAEAKRAINKLKLLIPFEHRQKNGKAIKPRVTENPNIELRDAKLVPVSAKFFESGSGLLTPSWTVNLRRR